MNKGRLMQAFRENSSLEPAAIGMARGRVNLMGEHTDYNDGFVLPMAIPQQTLVGVGRNSDNHFYFVSCTVDEESPVVIQKPLAASPQAAHFSRYLIGCVCVLMKHGFEIPPATIVVDSTVPIGAGLSSSAALEVATLRALRTWQHLPLDDVQIAQLAQRAEQDYAGVTCGIMDQMAASLGDTGACLFLDTRTLEYQRVPMPESSSIVVLDSGHRRTLATSGYNQRRAECENAAELLHIRALRDVDNLSDLNSLPDPLLRRARHVVKENQRVLEARTGTTASQLGRLMNESHRSLRDDFEVSVAALDILVKVLQQHPNVYGAKLTGAGFGGACVALVAKGLEQLVIDDVLAKPEILRLGATALVPFSRSDH